MSVVKPRLFNAFTPGRCQGPKLNGFTRPSASQPRTGGDEEVPKEVKLFNGRSL